MTNNFNSIGRRDFMKTMGLAASAMAIPAAMRDMASWSAPDGSRPNILWISTEDISPDLGCYGVEYANTPNIDKFAEQGTIFTNVFTNHGVCAPMRSCTITGMYPSAIGTNYMRCRGVPPAEVKCFPEYIRAQGYYCTNNSKTDYQFEPPLTAWDESSNKADWRGRPEGKPFYSVINFTSTHESKIRAKYDSLEHDPDKAKVPPYYPDTPVTRKDWARYHDLISGMDKQFQAVLDKLEADGLSEDTIVWFWGDHGRGLPRAKRWLYESGTLIPLIIRVPKKFRAMAGAGKDSRFAPGTKCHDLISNIDFAPTMLSLVSAEAPAHFQGQAFMGPAKASPREYIYGARDRIDEAYDKVRAVRDKRYRLIRNFMPYLTRALDVDYMNQMPTMKEMRRLHAEGKLEDGPQMQYFEPTRPLEELYDVEKDPHEVNNLAGKPEYRDIQMRLRKEMRRWMMEIGDMGLIPEPDFEAMKRPGGKIKKTATPRAAVTKTTSDGDVVELTCPTDGASIAWRSDGGSGRVGWSLYTEPITLKKGRAVRAIATRIGFKDSNEITFAPGKGIVAGKRENPPQGTHWREQLDKTDLLERLMKLRDLDFEGAKALDTYFATLDDKDAPMRYWAVVWIHQLAKDDGTIKRAIGAIKPMLKDESESVRCAAAQALTDWGMGEQALPVLESILTDSWNQYGRLYAATALNRLGEKARPAIAAIRKSLKDKNRDVGKVSEYTLRGLADKA